MKFVVALIVAFTLGGAATAVQAQSAVPSPPPATDIQTDATVASPASIALPHDLSPRSMFLSADAIVKTVMVSLALASLTTWTIFFGKTIEMVLARRRLSKALARTDKTLSFKEANLALAKDGGLLADLVHIAEDEIEVSGYQRSGIKERCESRVSERARAETQGMRRGMGVLATIGAISPFVGLFGTVWGIMNSFIGISKAQTTNLAVVAPGIAEALLATAIGLVAAVPAVIIYNYFSQMIRRYNFLVSRAAGTAHRLLSRELDRRNISAISAAE